MEKNTQHYYIFIPSIFLICSALYCMTLYKKYRQTPFQQRNYEYIVRNENETRYSPPIPKKQHRQLYPWEK